MKKVIRSCVQKIPFDNVVIRVVLIDNEPWYVLVDICNILEINVELLNFSNSIFLRTDTKVQEFLVVNNSDIALLLQNVDDSVAKRFQRRLSKNRSYILQHGVNNFVVLCGVPISVNLFLFNNHVVRILEKEKQLWWVLKDICNAIGVLESDIQWLDDDEKQTIDTFIELDNKELFMIINESGLYNIVYRLDILIAKQFKRWMFQEMLPVLRQNEVRAGVMSMLLG
jgi:prophage antirepressor-like protein